MTTHASHTIQLPKHAPAEVTPVLNAIHQRRSVRAFARAPLTLQQIGNLAWATQGVTNARGFRAAPSAGAIFPLEIYVATEAGLYRYLSAVHALETVAASDVRHALAAAALGQRFVADAGAVFIFTAVYARILGRYGERAHMYTHMEVGHAAQNLMLHAVELGLGTVAVGAFDDAAVALILGPRPDETPVYLVPVGRPKGA